MVVLIHASSGSKLCSDTKTALSIICLAQVHCRNCNNFNKPIVYGIMSLNKPIKKESTPHHQQTNHNIASGKGR